MDGIRIDTTGEVELTLSKEDAAMLLTSLVVLQEVLVMTPYESGVIGHITHGLRQLGVKV